MSKKRSYQDSYVNFGFSYLDKNGIHLPQCVLCLKTLSNSSMKPFQLKQHLENIHPEHKEKCRQFFETKLESLKRLKLDSSGAFHKTSKAIVHASYAISYQIAKSKKPHTIGESLIKPCFLECAQILLDKEAYNKIRDISLSNDTVASRICDMADNVKSQVLLKITSSPLFAIQLDESTDVANLSQLLVFVRYLNNVDRKIEEDFLFCKPLETTSKGTDVMELVTKYFESNNLSWENLIGVCTDGAPAMLGSRSGFTTLVKLKNPDVVATHCMIHREALASKTLPENLKSLLIEVIRVVNHIKGSALNTRLFHQLCDKVDATHLSLIFHTQVRWLTKGNMLARFFELRYEVKTFLEDQQKLDFLAVFNEPTFETSLAYLADIFEELNKLNLQMQGRKTTIIKHCDSVNAFIAKLSVWNRRINEGNAVTFDRLSTILRGDPVGTELRIAIGNHLTTLCEEFKRYFPGIDTDDITMKLTRNPFRCQVHEIAEDKQDEFLELQYNSSAKDEFNAAEDLGEFWVKMLPIYPQLSNVALRILLPFSSTYLCEAGFSSLLEIKSKTRSKLEVENDLRCALSKTSPQIEKLVAKKNVQVSH